ncbi:MAG: hypothetical protein PUB20_06770 [Clostridia bacterium]|nr:hypothetical protein [Clostridia bacterium]
MSDNMNKKEQLDSDELLNQMMAEEIMKNDDIDKYTEGESLSALKSKYEALDSDEDILAEDLRPRQKKGLFHKQRPIEYSGYFYEPAAANNPNELKTPEVSQDFSSQFDTAQSEFDRDSVSFRDISLDSVKETGDEETDDSHESNESEIEEAPVTPNTDNTESETESDSDFTRSYISDYRFDSFEFDNSSEERPQSDGFSSSVNRGYNTNTKVVFSDENSEKAPDGNPDGEISSLFSSEPNAAQHSRRFNPFKSFRRKKIKEPCQNGK